eukprot:gene6181-6895_t
MKLFCTALLLGLAVLATSANHLNRRKFEDEDYNLDDETEDEANNEAFPEEDNDDDDENDVNDYRSKKKTALPKHWYDRCLRRCQVRGRRLVNCYRVREDFESMTATKQKRFINTYYTVSTKQPYKSKFDKLIRLHETNFNTRIHKIQEFFPWHRWFILALENLLREVDCRVTVPYWDWSIWSHDPWDKKKMWSANHGLGGNGRKGDGCVTTGMFRLGKWKTTSGKCLKRGFNGSPPDADQVAIAIKEPSFKKFELMTRVNLHEGVHCLINGTMCSGKSAEAPEFFFHHGFIDKIWADYQKKSHANKFIYYPKINKKMVAIKYYPRDLINLDKQPGGVKVMHFEPNNHHAKQIRAYLRKLSLSQLEHLRRLSFSLTSENAKNLFHLSGKERREARKLEAEARQNVATKRQDSIFEKTLSSLERVEGFRFPGGE